MTITSNTSTINVTAAPTNTMKLGVLLDYGFYKYTDPTITINRFKAYTGIDTWKLGIRWSVLEPTHGSYNTTYLNAIKQVLNAAQTNGNKIQITFGQQWFPGWTLTPPTGTYEEKGERYTNSTINNYFRDIWKYLVNQIKSYSALDSYLLVNEENWINFPSSNIYQYTDANKVIIDAIRTIDTNTNHKITIRPNIFSKSDSTYKRTLISQKGNHDYDYGTGEYPTGAYLRQLPGNPPWDHYANPLSNTSFIRMARQLRTSVLSMKVSNQYNKNIGFGIGEIGIPKGTLDTYGDAEKLKAFKRAMAIAYESGYYDFLMWASPEVFCFANPQTYFPQLKTFRNTLLSKPRKSSSNKYNIRVVIDTGEPNLVSGSITEEAYPELNMADQKYYHLIRRLDEEGWSWYVTHQAALSIQPTNIYNATILTSEIKDKTIAQQDAVINARTSGLTRNGFKYPWDTGEVIF